MSNNQVAQARAEYEMRRDAVRKFVPPEYQAGFDKMCEAAEEYADQQYHEGVSVGQYYATGGD